MAKKKGNKTGAKGKSSGFFKKVIISFVVIIGIIGGGTAYYSYNRIYKPNVELFGKNQAYLYIKTGSTFEDVLANLVDNNIIKNASSFQWVAGVCRV